ncbi:FAD binding domain-containing protein [Dothidotthia symphoricarpi CBS 119687]|uniref:Delta(24)-sterol reductase n=1 Tax=Dothidotthia symphoricarpi CBS 119687 TaxID=1392245 RepID=A0A6A6AME8_9PLEO|nr:FAD binding domain-containing protein [Dothidotthia symphoricarpi CBS 119687]KAF2132308.1 FAD binding domain-containing protein [Dothidotthia symphoricarpi CBS 119687]
MEAHIATVQKVRSRVEHFYATTTPFRVYHGSTNSTRHADFDRDAIVDVSSLNHVLSIDYENRTALVEPNVPMDALVRETMKAGLLPPVVMEFPGITVGGGFVGTAGESSSFKYGFFDRTVLSAEVVLADGSLVTASAKENQELFEGLRGSFGTLGVLTMVEMQLIPLRQMVEVTYHPTTSFAEAMSKMQEQTATQENDYVDGVLFSKNSGVIVAGRLVDTNACPTIPIRRFSRPWDEWFWIYAKSLTRKATSTTELVPITDYLFRYDRGAFWMGWYAYTHFMVPFTWFTRFLLDYFMHTRIMYHALHASGYTDRYIIQDIAFPAGNAEAFVEYVDHAFGIYPLWLCPLRKDGRASMGHAQFYSGAVGGKQDGVYEGEYINVGVWGPYPSSEVEYVRANRDLEAKMRELGGLKWLYSRVFYTEDEWWQDYDKPRYDDLRRKFNATSLPTIWDKVKDRGRKEDFGKGLKGWLKRVVKSNGLLSGFYGIYKALRGGDYMLKKKRS